MKRLSGISSNREFSPATPVPAETSEGEAQDRVFILSDVRLYRDGLSSALSLRPDLKVIGASAPTAEALAQIGRSQVCAVLLDIAMPSALVISKNLSQLTPRIRVVAFAVTEIDETMVAYVEAGILGFVTRDGTVDDLVNAIRNAIRGDIICSPRFAGLLARRVATLSDQSPETNAVSLTRREREIASLVGEGMANKEIARSLEIGSATVKNHIHNILGKLQVNRRGEAAARLRGDVAGHVARRSFV